jgi:glycosyltransferase involved in cell wall biosynthesis
MPNAALEALACGTPVIATPEAGGAGEIGNGVTIADWPAGFAAALAAIRSDRDGILRPSLLPRRFTAAQIAEDFLKIVDP